MSHIKEISDGVQIKVKVQPRASKNQVVGWMEDVLKVRLTAPPVKGEANAALLRFFADYFGISRSAVSLVSGATSRQKTVQIKGLSVLDIERRLDS